MNLQHALWKSQIAMNTPALLLVLAALALSSCSRTAHGHIGPEKFTAGFWCWGEMFANSSPSSLMPDSMYVLAGHINPPGHPLEVDSRRQWTVYESLALKLPPASEYWMVYRDEAQLLPDAAVTDKLVDSIWTLWGQARIRHLKMAGIQLDIDSPTGQLAQYAIFLANVRKRLPPGCRLSITALLDWFRNGTAIGDVIRQVDEFVPQFYDLAEPRNVFPQYAVGAKFDGAKWGPTFNRFDKRFRIGISTFGRARSLQGYRSSLMPLSSHSSHFGQYYADLAPLDLAVDPAYRVSAHHNEAGELILDYTALHGAGSNDDKRPTAGAGVEFTVATPEAVRAAADSARTIGGRCAGIVFFRWPERNETLVMQPDEALAAAGFEPAAPDGPVAIAQVDANCAAVKCADIYLVHAKPWAPQRARYRIQASGEMEYFMPDLKPLVRMSGPSQLEANLPPYTGRGRIFLGRAVSRETLRFTVEPPQ